MTIPVALRRPYPELRVASSLQGMRDAPVPLVVAPLLILAGVALLAWTYALLPEPPLNHLAYWTALTLAYVGVVLIGTVAAPRAPRQLMGLGIFGLVTWLPYYLRSPDRLLFVDERYHLDILQRMAASGSSILEPRQFPLPGTFPGLENVALTLMAWTGLAPEPAARLVTLSIHVVIPMLAYLGARGVGLGRRGAFIAALVYAANTSYFFFHSVFSYESLGILLFLSTWALVGLYRGAPRLRRVLSPRDLLQQLGSHDPEAVAAAALRERRQRTLVFVALPIVAGIAVTHHVSSYLLALSLYVAWIAARVVGARSTSGIRNLALLATVFSVAWFAISSERVAPYLAGTITARIDVILDTLLVERSQPRALFANSDLPAIERAMAFLYPPLVLVLSVAGLWVAWQHRRRSLLWLAFAIVGPIGWILTTPAVLTRSGELAYRSWPFLFLGVGVFIALALLELARRIGRRRPGLARPVVFAIVGLLLLGGFSIGDNQAGRFPTLTPLTAAGSANATQDQVAAARWLRETAGEGNLVATDGGSAVTFSTDGGQRILGWQSWYPFLVEEPDEIVPFMVDTGVEYLVVDRQLTELPPRYGDYFGAPAVPEDLEPGQPFPAALFDRLDGVSGLQRIYDGGRMQIYSILSVEGDDASLPEATPSPSRAAP